MRALLRGAIATGLVVAISLAAAYAGRALAEGEAKAPAVLDYMKTVVNPAATAFWAAGNGGPDGEPAAAAEQRWKAAGAAAADLQTAGAWLAKPANSRGPEWNAFAGRLAKVGSDSAEAVRKRDPDAALEVGGALSEACDACHSKYMPARQ